MQKRLTCVILIAIMMCTLIPIFGFPTTRAQSGMLKVDIVDSVTGEKLNGINVQAVWGSASETYHSHGAFSYYGYVYFELGVNYSGDVNLSAWDNGRRYLSKDKLVHVTFREWINTTAQTEIKLDRVTPLQKSYSGTYIKSLIKDREVVYYDESAYIVLDLRSPYYDNHLSVSVPSDMASLVDIYGAGYISRLPFEGNVTVRIHNSGYSHFEKSGIFNLILWVDAGFDTLDLETVQFTLTLKPSWGYENCKLKVRAIDAQSKGNLNFIGIEAWWGSSFNKYEYQPTLNEGTATFDLGAYPSGSVRLRLFDSSGQYVTQFNEVTVIENPTSVTFELQRAAQDAQDGQDQTKPIPFDLWIAVALIAVGCVVTVSIVVFRKRRPTTKK